MHGKLKSSKMKKKEGEAEEGKEKDKRENNNAKEAMKILSISHTLCTKQILSPGPPPLLVFLCQ